MNDGILLLHKPVGITSHDAVNRMRRLFGTRAVGHTGTLDPMASGLLVILIGNATKASEYAMEHDKSYRAGLFLGITTDTEDTPAKFSLRATIYPRRKRFSPYRGALSAI